ncbi:membrane protein [Neptunitalea chrysea]|uniref:UPF0056 membrane protein n=2 Tax=Neptunitalea chrysea TaxID=1647581 RepID=A0A9W6B7I9_9FLAO|nr:membrane protein [Neptunitalea chrysea]
MNPLSVGVIMLSLLQDDTTAEEIKGIAYKASKSILIALVIIFFIGQYIFKFLGVSPDGLRVFGGLILLIMGINMVQGHGKKVNHSTKEQEAAGQREDISIVPLAIPVAVGPGLITTVLNMSVVAADWQHYLSGSVAIIICCVSSYFILGRMPYIKMRLGVNGLRVFNRIMGLVVGSLAAQMILAGVSKFL